MIIENLLALAVAATMNVTPVTSADAVVPAKPSVTAEQNQCPDLEPATIRVEQFRGQLLENHAKSAFQIAREKDKRYDIDMPLRQGNMGNVDFKTLIDVDMRTYPGMGCLILTGIHVKVEVDNKIEIANDFGKETCLYSEFYSLELELMQQDEEIINNEIIKLREYLKQIYGQNNVFATKPGVNIDWFKKEKQEAIEHLINNYVYKIEQKITEARRESDLPEFYDEIVADCAGARL